VEPGTSALRQAWDDSLNWLVGLFYFEEDRTNINPIEFPNVHLVTGAIVENQSWAIFGQMTYDFAEKWSLTLGGRYTDEQFDSIINDEHQYVTALFNEFVPGGYIRFAPNELRIQPHGVFESDETEFDPYVSLAYQWTDDLLVYASYSEGFKGGGFTSRIRPGGTVEEFGPEYATVYEVGGKWSA